MKKIFSIFAAGALMLTSCTDIWLDHDAPQLYFGNSGCTVNDVWTIEGESYCGNLTVYCSGIRPDSKAGSVVATFAVDNSLVEHYNEDISQQYSGQVEILPESCYSLPSSMSVTIPAGSAQVSIPIEFNLDAVKAACTNPDKIYAVPVKLTSTDKYVLNSDETLTEAIYGIRINNPRFYFYNNRDGVVAAGKKLVIGEENLPDHFYVAAYGVPMGNYKLDVVYDPAALEKEFPGSLILPESCYTAVTTEMVYKDAGNMAVLKVEYNPEGLEYGKAYYLPLTITTAKYDVDEAYKTIFIKVEIKNEYEGTYSSRLSVEAESTGRIGTYSVTKDIVSYTDDTIEMQVATNNTVAGGSATSTSGATTYNDKYFRLKIIPTDNKERYNVEYILVTDKAKANNTPATFEPDPENESYYDWNGERLVLNYRWKHTDGKWINVSEILIAN